MKNKTINISIFAKNTKHSLFVFSLTHGQMLRRDFNAFKILNSSYTFLSYTCLNKSSIQTFRLSCLCVSLIHKNIYTLSSTSRWSSSHCWFLCFVVGKPSPFITLLPFNRPSSLISEQGTELPLLLVIEQWCVLSLNWVITVRVCL